MNIQEIPLPEMTDNEEDFIEIRHDDIVVASWEALKKVATGCWCCFVWEGEEELLKSKEYEPLIIDAFTARAMVTVHDALQAPEKRAKFERMVGLSRGNFGRLVDLTWKCVS